LGVEVWCHAFLTSALGGCEWSALRPGCFTPGERAPGNSCIGGWVGPRAGLDAVEKRKIPSPLQESNPQTPIVQATSKKNMVMCPTGARRPDGLTDGQMQSDLDLGEMTA
jgi:hypothetical protein